MIYAAERRREWPGEAAVVVSVVHVHKGPLPGPHRLDGRPVERITAFLFEKGGDDDPTKLAANAGKSFIGSYVLGMGFTFDDTERRGVANPTSLMRELIAKDPRNAERIFPYIGGEELNDDPEQRPHRWVINFEDLSEKEARAGWPDLIRIVEEKVRPARAHLTTNAIGRKRAQYWWQYGSPAKELYEAIRNLPRVLAIARVGQHGAFTFLPNGMVYSEALVVFALPTDTAFCALQARPHEVWARFLASSMKDDMRYTPSDCFETFPFPEGFETDPALEAAGKAYDEHRARIMRARREGLTKTYNRFHDPNCHDADIEELRRLHRAMDEAVLRAYGWEDLVQKAVPVFLDEGDEDDHAWRGRLAWPAAVREEVLARLLALNAERARAEAAAAAVRPNRRRRA